MISYKVALSGLYFCFGLHVTSSKVRYLHTLRDFLFISVGLGKNIVIFLLYSREEQSSQWVIYVLGKFLILRKACMSGKVGYRGMAVPP